MKTKEQVMKLLDEDKFCLYRQQKTGEKLGCHICSKGIDICLNELRENLSQILDQIVPEKSELDFLALIKNINANKYRTLKGGLKVRTSTISLAKAICKEFGKPKVDIEKIKKAIKETGEIKNVPISGDLVICYLEELAQAIKREIEG